MHVKVKSTKTSLERFDTMFAETRRRYLLRRLDFVVDLTRTANLCHFYDKALRAIFSRLQRWTGVCDDSSEPLSLFLHISFRQDDPNTYQDKQFIFFDNRHPLPSVPHITEVHHGCCPHFFHESIVWALMIASPRIKSIEVDARFVYDDLIDSKEATIPSFQSSSFSRIERVSIDNTIYPREFCSRVPYDSLDSGGSHPFSTGINRILKAPACKSLALRGCYFLSPEALDLDGRCENTWENFESICLDLDVMTPDGRWYFTSDEDFGVDSEDERSRRILYPNLSRYERFSGYGSRRCDPNPATFNPFLIALVRAALRIKPRDGLRCYFDAAARIEYITPGTRKSELAQRNLLVSNTRFFDITMAAENSHCWVMSFEIDKRNRTSNPGISGWEVPSEVIEILTAAGHRIYYSRARWEVPVILPAGVGGRVV